MQTYNVSINSKTSDANIIPIYICCVCLFVFFPVKKVKRLDYSKARSDIDMKFSGKVGLWNKWWYFGENLIKCRSATPMNLIRNKDYDLPRYQISMPAKKCISECFSITKIIRNLYYSDISLFRGGQSMFFFKLPSF